MRKVILGVFLVGLMGCSHFTERQNCVIEGAVIGMAFGGGIGLAAILSSDCGPRCEEHKIARGESIHETVQHHFNRTNDWILYGALPGSFVAALIGAGIGYATCSDGK